MTRGNQRDLAREKAAKKGAGKGKAANEQEANKGLTKEQRMARYETLNYSECHKIGNCNRPNPKSKV